MTYEQAPQKKDKEATGGKDIISKQKKLKKVGSGNTQGGKQQEGNEVDTKEKARVGGLWEK